MTSHDKPKEAWVGAGPTHKKVESGRQPRLERPPGGATQAQTDPRPAGHQASSRAELPPSWPRLETPSLAHKLMGLSSTSHLTELHLGNPRPAAEHAWSQPSPAWSQCCAWIKFT